MKASSIISLASAAASIVAPAIAAAVAELESGVARSVTRRRVKSAKAKSSGSNSHPQTADSVHRPRPSSSKSGKKSSTKVDNGYEILGKNDEPLGSPFPFYHHQANHLLATSLSPISKSGKSSESNGSDGGIDGGGNYYFESGMSSSKSTKSSSKSSVEGELVFENEPYGLFRESPSKSTKSSSKSGKSFSKSSKAFEGEVESAGLFERPPSKSAKPSFKSGKAFSKSSQAFLPGTEPPSKSAKSDSKSGKAFSKAGKAFNEGIESAGESHGLFDTANLSNTRETDTFAPSGVPTTPPTTRVPTREPTPPPSPLSITKSLGEEKSEYACTADPCPISTWCRSLQGTCGPDKIYCGGLTTWTSTCPPSPTAGPTITEPAGSLVLARPALRSSSPAGPITAAAQPTLRPSSLTKTEPPISFDSPPEEEFKPVVSDSKGILEEEINGNGSIDPLDSQLGARVDPPSAEDPPAGLAVANMVIIAVAAAMAALVGLILATSYARQNELPVGDAPPGGEGSRDAAIA